MRPLFRFALVRPDIVAFATLVVAIVFVAGLASAQSLQEERCPVVEGSGQTSEGSSPSISDEEQRAEAAAESVAHWRTTAFGCLREGACGDLDERRIAYIVVEHSEGAACTRLRYAEPSDSARHGTLAYTRQSGDSQWRITYGTDTPPTVSDWSLYGPASRQLAVDRVANGLGRIARYARCVQRLSVVEVTVDYTLLGTHGCSGDSDLRHVFHTRLACEHGLATTEVHPW